MSRRCLIRSAPLAIALCGSAAAGAQASATMAVSVSVVPNCTVAAAPLAFGSAPADQAGALDASAAIEVWCAAEVPFTVDLDGGRNPDGGSRRASDPATGRTLAYDIFVDPAHSRRWGGPGGEAVSSATDAGGVARLTAYGLILGDGQTAAGSYADLVTVTIAF